MRIAIATWTGRRVGGVESYLADVIPALAARGHQVALLFETDAPFDRDPIAARGAIAQWCAADGAAYAVKSLREWNADVVFVQGLEDASLEARAAALAPSVLFAHVYRGTCISGRKSFAAFNHAPCHHRLGAGCLVRYLPNRCGGFDPRTMLRLYRQESQRQSALGRYAAVVTFSKYMRDEYISHGADPACTYVLPSHAGGRLAGRRPLNRAPSAATLMFAGRMEDLKGGHVLIDALPIVQAELDRPLYVTFVGDGTSRASWQARAHNVLSPATASHVEFTGWIAREELNRRFVETDLLVVPSLWPEPFGLIGVEAAAAGVPAAAFPVGGITEWLIDNVNGHVAAQGGSGRALADAIVRCLAEPAHHERLVAGAFEMAAQHTLEAHVSALLDVLSTAAEQRQLAAAI